MPPVVVTRDCCELERCVASRCVRGQCQGCTYVVGGVVELIYMPAAVAVVCRLFVAVLCASAGLTHGRATGWLCVVMADNASRGCPRLRYIKL